MSEEIFVFYSLIGYPTWKYKKNLGSWNFVDRMHYNNRYEDQFIGNKKDQTKIKKYLFNKFKKLQSSKKISNFYIREYHVKKSLRKKSARSARSRQLVISRRLVRPRRSARSRRKRRVSRRRVSHRFGGPWGDVVSSPGLGTLESVWTDKKDDKKDDKKGVSLATITAADISSDNNKKEEEKEKREKREEDNRNITKAVVAAETGIAGTA